MQYHAHWDNGCRMNPTYSRDLFSTFEIYQIFIVRKKVQSTFIMAGTFLPKG